VAAFVFIVLLVAGIFAFDIGKRWWDENAWRRRWRRKPEED
jgi:hypothetical protein